MHKDQIIIWLLHLTTLSLCAIAIGLPGDNAQQFHQMALTAHILAISLEVLKE